MGSYTQLWIDLFPVFRTTEKACPRVTPMSGNCVRHNIVSLVRRTAPALA